MRLQALFQVEQHHGLQQARVVCAVTALQVVRPLMVVLCVQVQGVGRGAEDQDGDEQVPDLRAHLRECCVLECLIPLTVIL